MEQLRPTFSESWYRVADLRIRLRGSAQITRQFYRGERWYVVRDPAGNQFHRLSAPAYKFVGLLDGSRTVAEAWELVGGQLADDAPTQNEVIQILSQLHSANLVEADITPDAAVLLRRHKRMVKKQWQGRMMNLLFPRIPLWDPDRFLKLWMPVARHIFSWFGALVWVAVVIFAILKLIPEGDKLIAAAKSATAIGEHPEKAVFLWASFVLIKAIHELGHAFACRRFGGEVHELGIMFLIFVPTPYVDASTAWGFPNKWARIFVGAAGMIVEIFVASICAFIWLNTAENSFVNQLAYNVMLIASVSTVLFNANPLLRYDGYYILSDWLEIPNLRHRSNEYALGLIKRHLFRVRLPYPLPPIVQRIWLFLYAVLSAIYRVFIGVIIILVVTQQVPVLGILMAIGGVVTWLVVPVVKTLKYLLLEAELHRKRARAAAWVGAFVTAVVILVGFIPFTPHFQGASVLEPVKQQTLRARESGFVQQVLVRDGEHVTQGQELIVCRNPTLDTEIAVAEAEVAKAQAALEHARAVEPWQMRAAQAQFDYAQRMLDRLRDRRERLRVVAPFDGVVIAPELRNLSGRYLQATEEIAKIYQPGATRVRVNLDLSDAALVFSEDVTDVKVRLAGAVGTELPATVDGEVIATAQRELSHAAAGSAAGGDFAVDPSDQTGAKLQGLTFWVTVQLGENARDCLPGQTAQVRFYFGKKPLAWQWGRRFWQLVQQNSSGKWL